MRTVALALALLLAAPLAAGAEEPYRWPDGAESPFGRDEVRVHLDLSNLTDANRAFGDEARKALRWWEDGGNGRLKWNVTFVEVATREEADIVLWFRDDARVGPVCGYSETALGCARPLERPVPIEIVARGVDGSVKPFLLVREVAKHEIGHAIGFPHSENPRDIMAAHASRSASTSWRYGEHVPALVGVGVAVALLVGSTAAFGRWMRREAALRALNPLAEGEPCARDADGRHAFARRRVRVLGREEAWDVCLACRRGRRAP